MGIISPKGCQEKIRYAPYPYQPAKVSNFVRQAKELKPGQVVGLAARVSNETQFRNGNLADQEERLRREAEGSLGVKVAFVHLYVGPGQNPYWLFPAVQKSLELGGIPLLAETVCRLKRPDDFDYKTNQMAEYLVTDMRQLRHATQGLPLYVLEDPNASPGQNRSSQTIRGQKAKGHPGGRPPRESRPQRRVRGLAMIRDYYRKGASKPGIAKRVARKIGVSIQTTYKWIKKAVPHWKDNL